MDTRARVLRAVHNNAAWCDAVCRAHGAPGEFHDAYWVNRGKLPPYISRLVTLDGAECAPGQLEAIVELLNTQPAAFSVKDAFQCLDLASLGFGVLFDATWIEHAPEATLPFDPTEQLRWSVVRNPDELAEWEVAWRGSSANAATEGLARVFVPSLLAEPGFHFLAGRRGDAVVASAALNRTGSVVGLSNVFSSVVDVGPLFPGCVRLARELYADLPIVGYERGDDLSAAERAGFARVHALTVWRRGR